MKKYAALLLCLAMLLSLLLTGCTREVALDYQGLENMNLAGVASCTTKTDYEGKLMPVENYVLPDEISVLVDGEELTLGDYEYDSFTGELIIYGDAITGDVTISGTAVESVAGTWMGTVNMGETIRSALEMQLAVPEDLDLGDLPLTYEIEFLDDGTCTMYIPQEANEAFAQEMYGVIYDIMYIALEQGLDSQGDDRTVEEFLEDEETSLEELIEASGATALTDSLAQGLNVSGTYDAEACEILMEGSGDANPYTLEDGILTIEASQAEIDSGMADMMYPMVLQRN